MAEHMSQDQTPTLATQIKWCRYSVCCESVVYSQSLAPQQPAIMETHLPIGISCQQMPLRGFGLKMMHSRCCSQADCTETHAVFGISHWARHHISTCTPHVPNCTACDSMTAGLLCSQGTKSSKSVHRSAMTSGMPSTMGK